MSQSSRLFYFLIFGLLIFLFPMSPWRLSVQHAHGSTSITLAWNANEEVDVPGYKLYYGSVKGAYAFAFDVTNQSTHTISVMTFCSDGIENIPCSYG